MRMLCEQLSVFHLSEGRNAITIIKGQITVSCYLGLERPVDFIWLKIPVSYLAQAEIASTRSQMRSNPFYP